MIRPTRSEEKMQMAQFVRLNGNDVAVEDTVMSDLGLRVGQEITDRQLGRIIEGNLGACRAALAIQQITRSSAAKAKGA